MRMRQRNISRDQIILLARSLETGPEVPHEKCFRRFAGFMPDHSSKPGQPGSLIRRGNKSHL